MTQQDPTATQKERLSQYATKLRELKERSALREIVERELLLTFIRANQQNINEFPMLPAQQKSVIRLMSNRGEHPAYDYIQRLAGNLITQVNHYDKAMNNGNDEERTRSFGELNKTEALLIRCVQGIVYGMGLITDNFEELVLRHFGQSALSEYGKLIEEHELDHSFWSAFVEQFVGKRNEAAYEEIAANRKYSIAKENKSLVIRFLFDDILAQLNPVTQKVEKTRIQVGYDEFLSSKEKLQVVKVVMGVLKKGLAFLPDSILTDKRLLHLARIVSLDPVAGEFMKTAAAQAKQPTVSDEEKTGLAFLNEQLVANGVGAVIAGGMTSQIFIDCLEKFLPGTNKQSLVLGQGFDLEAIEDLLFYLLEHHFMYLIRSKVEDEGGKVVVRSSSIPRVSEADVDKLPKMNKIRKRNIWIKDNAKDGMLLFRTANVKQLAALANKLQLEPELRKGLASMWNSAGSRVDIIAAVNLELVARGTTNLKGRIAEILAKFNVSLTPPAS